MAAERTFQLEEFKKGDIIAWEVLTQCGYTASVTLKQGKKTIFEASKTSGDWHIKVLAQNNYILESSEVLILTIRVNESIKIDSRIQSNAIVDSRARAIGHIYNICIEDSDDEDYNDVYVNVVGWSKKG